MFQKEKKASKHHTATAEVCPELDQPDTKENPVPLHLLKMCENVS